MKARHNKQAATEARQLARQLVSAPLPTPEASVKAPTLAERAQAALTGLEHVGCYLNRNNRERTDDAATVIREQREQLDEAVRLLSAVKHIASRKRSLNGETETKRAKWWREREAFIAAHKQEAADGE